MKRREPSAVPSMLQSPWHVPVRWFVLVDGEERRLVGDGSGDYRLYYWTPIGLARRRAERALQALRHSELSPVAGLVRDLGQWLSSFDPHSMVELDYASVSDLFTWDELDPMFDDDKWGRKKLDEEIPKRLAARSPHPLATGDHVRRIVNAVVEA